MSDEQPDKDAKHVFVRTSLVESLCEHQAAFWYHLDLDAYDMTDDEAAAIDLSSVMEFAAIALGQVQREEDSPLTKEQWIAFCEKVYERAEFDQIEVTTTEVGDA